MPERHMTGTSPRIIDAWGNLALDGTIDRAPDVARLFRQSGTSHILDQGLSAAATVEAMDQAGIERMLVTAWHRPGSWRYSDRRVRELVSSYPERFVGIASVDVQRPREAVDSLRRAVEVEGFKGLRIVPWLWNRPPDDSFYYALYAACIELDVPVGTQVGHTGPLCPSEPGRPIPYLERVALEFPELRIVGGHLGYPWTDEMIALATKLPNVFIDTSAHLPRYYPPQLLRFLAGDGRGKVLFATNFPMLPLNKCAAQVEALGLDSSVANNFLGDNCRRVYKLD
jgi:predicted TIM-barrel fold metal-dependent hydrolase